ncbi:hypothetical protein JCM8547_006487 [Rhodosporidiobolus lusitaniae]
MSRPLQQQSAIRRSYGDLVTVLQRTPPGSGERVGHEPWRKVLTVAYWFLLPARKRDALHDAVAVISRREVARRRNNEQPEACGLLPFLTEEQTKLVNDLSKTILSKLPFRPDMIRKCFTTYLRLAVLGADAVWPRQSPQGLQAALPALQAKTNEIANAFGNLPYYDQTLDDKQRGELSKRVRKYLNICIGEREHGRTADMLRIQPSEMCANWGLPPFPPSPPRQSRSHASDDDDGAYDSQPSSLANSFHSSFYREPDAPRYSQDDYLENRGGIHDTLGPQRSPLSGRWLDEESLGSVHRIGRRVASMHGTTTGRFQREAAKRW